MVRTSVAALVASAILMAGCGDDSSRAPARTATALPTPSSTATVLTPTSGPSPTPSPTSCVGVAPSVEPIDSPTTRRVVTVRGSGVTCGANKRVIIDGPHDSFIVEDCGASRNQFDVQVQLDLGVNHISICQFSLCPSVCTNVEVERRPS